MIIHRSWSVDPQRRLELPAGVNDDFPAFQIAQRMDNMKIRVVSIMQDGDGTWHVYGQGTDEQLLKFQEEEVRAG